MEEQQMPNYDDLKKRAKDALDTIADVSVEAYKIAEEKAKVLAKRAKLNAEITREKGMIRRAKINIGAAYYELHKDDPEADLQQLCDEITASHDLIAAKQRELEELKKGFTTCDTDAEECDCTQASDDEDCECECPAPDDDAGECACPLTEDEEPKV